MSSEDPPAYEPPGPEITGQPAADEEEADKARGEAFKDEPEKGEYDDGDDPARCNFTPPVIILLVILNLIAAGAVGYLIWYAVDSATNTDAPTRAPSPPPTPAPTRSMRPSLTPSVSNQPSVFTATPPPTPSPTSSSAPTATASSSPTDSPFFCNLCGEGKTMSTTNLGSSVAFGSRVTRTCQELLTDQNNGDILEEQCIALYPSIATTCGCVATVGARDDTSIKDLLRDKVGTAIDTDRTDEATAFALMTNAGKDGYFASTKATRTDAEIIQRYLLILGYYQLNAGSSLDDLYAIDECLWPSVVACEYGQVTDVYLSGTSETASSTPAFPSDLINMTYVEHIRVENYAFRSSIPTVLPTNDLLKTLRLSGNGLTGTLPDALFELRSLTNLDLSNNAMSGDIGLSTKIKQLIRLTSLNLGTNGFTGTMPTCELDATKRPATLIMDCASEVTCTCCSSCADSTTGTV